MLCVHVSGRCVSVPVGVSFRRKVLLIYIYIYIYYYYY